MTGTSGPPTAVAWASGLVATGAPSRRRAGGRLLVSSVGAVGARVVAALVTFGANLLVARRLGVGASGAFFAAVAVATVVSAVARMGTDQAIVRALGGAGEAPSPAGPVVARVTRRVLVAACLLAAVLGAVVLGGAAVLDKADRVGTWLPALGAVPGHAVLSVHAFGAQASGRIWRMQALQAVAPAAFLVVAIWTLHPALPWQVLYVASTTIPAAVVVLAHRRRPGDGSPAPDLTVVMDELWATARSVWPVTVFAALQQWGALIVGVVTLDGIQLSHLGAAQRVGFSLSLILIGVNLVTGPRLAAASHSGDRAGFRRVYRDALGLSLVMSAPICLVLVTFAPSVMATFGPGYDDAGTTLVVVCIGAMVNVVTGPCQLALIMSGRGVALRNLTVMAVPLGLVLTVVLARDFGAVGAAAGMAGTLGVQNLAALLLLAISEMRSSKAVR